ncbi:MAG: hypothetical protein AAFR01_03150, partial [Pseudomonadota bacterium]
TYLATVDEREGPRGRIAMMLGALDGIAGAATRTRVERLAYQTTEDFGRPCFADRFTRRRHAIVARDADWPLRSAWPRWAGVLSRNRCRS